MSVLRLLLRAICWAFIGSIVTPLLGSIVMLVIISFDSNCGTPGDNGGCEMGIASIFVTLIPVGAIIFFFAIIVRAIWRSLEQELPK